MKVHSRLACVLLTLSMAACGGGSSSDDTDASTGTETGTTTPTPVTLTSVSVNQSTVALEVNQTIQLSSAAHYSDNSQKVATTVGSWVSANPSIATVSTGKVTAVTAGDTQISYSFEGQSVDVAVKVKPLPVVVTGLSLSQKTALSLVPNESYTLISTASYSDNSEQDVTALGQWSSSNDAVMSVDKGMLLAKSVGAATISHSFEGQKTQIVVNVLALTAITSLDITGEAFGGATLTATSVCEGCDANQTQYTWIIDSNDNQIFNDTIEVDGEAISDSVVHASSYKVSNQDLGKRFKLEAQAVSQFGDTKSAIEHVIYHSVVVEELKTTALWKELAFAALKSDGSIVSYNLVNDAFKLPDETVADLVDVNSISIGSPSIFVATKYDGSVVPWTLMKFANSFDDFKESVKQPFILFANNGFVTSDNSLNIFDYSYYDYDIEIHSTLLYQFDKAITEIHSIPHNSLLVKTEDDAWYSLEKVQGAEPELIAQGPYDKVIIDGNDGFALFINAGKPVKFRAFIDGAIGLDEIINFDNTVSYAETGFIPYQPYYANAIQRSDGSFSVWQNYNELISAFTIFSCSGDDDVGVECEDEEVLADVPEKVRAIVPSTGAFAAITQDESVFSWGNSTSGASQEFAVGGRQKLASDVKDIVSNGTTFAALKGSGEVVLWGSEWSMQEFNEYDAPVVQDSLSSGVIRLEALGGGYVAYKANGEAILFGNGYHRRYPNYMPEPIAKKLKSGVEQIIRGHYSFFLIMEDKTVDFWTYYPEWNGLTLGSHHLTALAPSFKKVSSSIAAP